MAGREWIGDERGGLTEGDHGGDERRDDIRFDSVRGFGVHDGHEDTDQGRGEELEEDQDGEGGLGK